MRVRANNASGGGGGGYATTISNYTSGTTIDCPFAFSEVLCAFRRSNNAEHTHYKIGDAKQKYYSGSNVNELTIGQATWTGIISEIGADNKSIKMAGTLVDLYVFFVK